MTADAHRISKDCRGVRDEKSIAVKYEPLDQSLLMSGFLFPMTLITTSLFSIDKI